MNVLARREVHHRVGAPQRRPTHLLDLFLDRRGDRRIADVGVDLHEEIAADRHRLAFGMVDVVRNDRPAAGDLVADEFGRHEFRDRRAERFAFVLMIQVTSGRFARDRQHGVECDLAAEIFADGDIFHLGRDDAFARVVHLRDARAGFARSGHAEGREILPSVPLLRACSVAISSAPFVRYPLSCGTISRPSYSSTSPRATIQSRRSAGKSSRTSCLAVRIGPNAARVINADGRIFLKCSVKILGRRKRDLAKRNPQVVFVLIDRAAVRFDVDLSRGRQLYFVAGLFRSVSPLPLCGFCNFVSLMFFSLRRYYPHQVSRITSASDDSPLLGAAALPKT